MSKSSIRFSGKSDEKLGNVQKTAERTVKRLQPLKFDKTLWSDNRPRSQTKESRRRRQEDPRKTGSVPRADEPIQNNVGKRQKSENNKTKIKNK